ncbi:hypothetical protein [Terasakiella sp. SH-1]|uniref:hypothetical protein n=1 Tax=Terasakiella sp. SH-1 TaxID=2560057 RepID=UPI0010730E96|nr:hypothetical protein [Terasakiella sp. SH-1]
MQDRDGVLMAIIGKKGSGKSYYAQHELINNDRLLVVDFKRSASWKRFADDNNMYFATSLADLVDVLVDNRDGNFRILYFPDAVNGRQEMHELCKLIFKIQRPYMELDSDEKFTLFIDEAHMANPLHDPYPFGTGLLEAITMGRESGISIIYSTQRPQRISTDFRENVDRVCTFKVSGKNAAKAVAAMCDDNEDIEKGVLDLKDYYHLYYEGGDVELVPPI